MPRHFFIGIDPGDRWTGVAMLRFDSEYRQGYAETFVLDQQKRSSLYFIVHRLHYYFSEMQLTTLRPERDSVDTVQVVIEDYQLRAAGHQKWAPGSTLRLIGALDHDLIVHRIPHIFVQPADPLKELPMMPVAKFVQAYRDEAWPRPQRQDWVHAFSAWRVLGRYFLSRHQPLCEAFSRFRISTLEVRSHRDYDFMTRDQAIITDLAAAAVTFRLPRIT